jgi:ornithine decarboxylase
MRRALTSTWRPTARSNLVRRLKIAPQRCIHTHPIKRDSDIRTALSFGVRHFVVDNPDELRKFVKFRSRAALLIRVCFRSPDAVVRPVAQVRLRS